MNLSSPHPKPYVIACAVLALDIKAVAEKLGIAIGVKYLEGGLHDRPHLLREKLQAAIDWLSIAEPSSPSVIIATSRYPNELIKLGKLVRRLDHTLLVMTDSSLCPLTQYAQLSLVAPSKHIPIIGSPATISCIINYLVLELASCNGGRLKIHQEKLEQAYRENDILFNLD